VFERREGKEKMTNNNNSGIKFDALVPAEMAQKAESVGVSKANLDFWSMFILAILAGAFIAFGAEFCTLVTTTTGLGFGITKLIGGLVFSLGLILVLVAGAELFTGNNLIVMAWASHKVSSLQLLRNWGIVYLGNFVGSISLVIIMYYTRQWSVSDYAVGANALATANAKVNLPFLAAFARGILCNVLVCLAVWLCFSARSVVDKICAIIFPITAFVASGFEHSIANMYFIPMGIVLKSQPAVIAAAGKTAADVANLNIYGFISNLVPVTLGNIFGGGLLVGAIYWIIYLRHREEKAEEIGEVITATPVSEAQAIPQMVMKINPRTTQF
jgi:formate/nitrite transporter